MRSRNVTYSRSGTRFNRYSNWSTMNANVSISVTPGSKTLWSVHSGQRRCTMRFASSTRSWNRRSSRSGAGSAISAHLCAFVGRDHVEREDEVARVVRAAERVVHLDVEHALIDGLEAHCDVLEVDPRLPPFDGHAHGVRDVPCGRRISRSEDVF